MNKLYPILALGLLNCGGKEETGADSGLIFQDLGSVTTDADGLSGDLVIPVPDNAVSALVGCGSIGADQIGTAYTLTSPDGATAFNYDDPMATAFRASTIDDYLPTLIPLSPDLDIAPGDWKLKLYTTAANATLTCQVVFKTSTADNVQVNLDVYLAGVGVDAAGAGADANVQAALTTLFDIWGAAGLKMGDVQYHDVADADTYSVVDVAADNDGEFNALLESADPGRDQTINLFLVQEIASDDGSTIFGMSGGPPGAAAIHGTSQSGIAVGAAGLADADGPAFIGRVAAHELGHFLGLFHTTEKDASSFDPLSDTPECDASKDTNGNGQMNTDECSGSGADNIMFWTGANTGLSSNQGWVSRRSPSVP